MNRVSATSRIVGVGLICALLWSAAGTAGAMAQTAAPPEAPASLNAVDFNFVGQANLGAPSRSTPAGWRKRGAQVLRSAVTPI
jgi:putative membrane protein